MSLSASSRRWWKGRESFAGSLVELEDGSWNELALARQRVFRGVTMSEGKPRHLLDGYKVLDFTHFVAGPTATRMMAGMGAEIIKVELAPGGDRARDVD